MAELIPNIKIMKNRNISIALLKYRDSNNNVTPATNSSIFVMTMDLSFLTSFGKSIYSCT